MRWRICVFLFHRINKNKRTIKLPREILVAEFRALVPQSSRKFSAFFRLFFFLLLFSILLHCFIFFFSFFLFLSFSFSFQFGCARTDKFLAVLLNLPFYFSDIFSRGSRRILVFTLHTFFSTLFLWFCQFYPIFHYVSFNGPYVSLRSFKIIPHPKVRPSTCHISKVTLKDSFLSFSIFHQPFKRLLKNDFIIQNTLIK